ncbi:hypothetical protein TWF718_009794 [Orbilia javanica]|uniref:Uncharacterized protein n=1 Tax=Orbilia javanica TaxID=47235 RepID=A0AAN8MQC0_9PEZI
MNCITKQQKSRYSCNNEDCLTIVRNLAIFQREAGDGAQKSLPSYMRPTIASSMRTVSKSQTIPAVTKQRTFLPVQLRGGVVPQGTKKAMAKAGAAATPRKASATTKGKTTTTTTTMKKTTKVEVTTKTTTTTVTTTASPEAPVEGPETVPGKLAAFPATTATAETTTASPEAPVEGPETVPGKLVALSATTAEGVGGSGAAPPAAPVEGPKIVPEKLVARSATRAMTGATGNASPRAERPRKYSRTLGGLAELLSTQSPTGIFLWGRMGEWKRVAREFLKKFPEKERRKRREEREKRKKELRGSEGHFVVRAPKLPTIEEEGEGSEEEEEDEGTVVRYDISDEEEEADGEESEEGSVIRYDISGEEEEDSD